MSGKAPSSLTSGAGGAADPWVRRFFRLAVMRLWGNRALSWHDGVIHDERKKNRKNEGEPCFVLTSLKNDGVMYIVY